MVELTALFHISSWVRKLDEDGLEVQVVGERAFPIPA